MQSESINRKRQQFSRQIRREYIQSFKNNIRKQLIADNMYGLSTSQQSNSVYQKQQQNQHESGDFLGQQYDPVFIYNMVADKDFKNIIKLVPLSHILRFVSDETMNQQQRRDRTFSGIQLNKVKKIVQVLYVVTNQHFKYKRHIQNKPLVRKELLDLISKSIQLLASSHQQQDALNSIQCFIMPFAHNPDFYELWQSLSFVSSEAIKNRALTAFLIHFSPQFIWQKFQVSNIQDKKSSLQLAKSQICHLYQFYYVLRSIRQFINSPPMVGNYKVINLMSVLIHTVKNITFIRKEHQQKNCLNKKNNTFSKQKIDDISQRIIDRKYQLQLEVINQCFAVTSIFISRQQKKHFNFLLQTNKNYISSIISLIDFFITQNHNIEKQIVKKTICNYYYLLNVMFSISRQSSIQIMNIRPQLIQKIVFHLKSIDQLIAKDNNLKMYKNMLMLAIIQNLRFIFQSVFSSISLSTLSFATQTLLHIFQKDYFSNVKKAISRVLQYPIVIIKHQETAQYINRKFSFQEGSFEKVQVLQSLKSIFRDIILFACIQICEADNENRLLQALQKLKGILLNITLDYIPQKKQIYMNFYHILVQYNIEQRLQNITLQKIHLQSTVKQAQISQRLIEGIEEQLGLRITDIN